MSFEHDVHCGFPWCRCLVAHEGDQPQLYADNLKCVSTDPVLLLNAGRFTTGHVWLVGQEEGDGWSVKFDVRDSGRHLDTTFRGWSATLAARARLVISRLVLIFALPLDFHGRVRVVMSMWKLRSSILIVVWSRRQPLAGVGAVLSLMDGPTVILHFAWCGLGFVCFVGILLFGPRKLVGFTVFWRW